MNKPCRSMETAAPVEVDPMDNFTVKRLLRRPWLSLLSFVIAAALCVTLCYLTGYLQRERERMEQIQGNYQVICVISDTRGTKTDDLGMTHFFTDFLLDEENGLGQYVRDPQLKKCFTYVLDRTEGQLLGVSRADCDTLLSEAKGGDVYIPEDFFESTEYICLVSKALYDRYAGQTLHLEITDPKGATPQYLPGNGHGFRDFTVAGWHSGRENLIYMPYPASQTLCEKLSGFTTTDSAAFLLADNGRIDELIQAAGEFFSPVQPGVYAPEGSRFGLIIRDEQYRATLAAMEQNIRRLRYLLPLIALLSLGAGFLVGFLGTRSEARTYALMRTVGLTRGRLFLLTLLEQLILPLLAALGIGATMGEPLPAAVFLTCHSVGCALAIFRAVRVSPAAILRKQE